MSASGQVSLSSVRSLMSFFCFVFRRYALSAFTFCFALIVGAPAMADGDIYVHAGANFKPVTIAVTPFAGEQPGDKISGVIASDFARSIFLLPLNSASFPETISNPDAAPNLDAWKTAAAQFVLTGRVLHQDAGRVTAQFRLWDTATGEQVAGQQYSTEAVNARRVSHMIADAVFSRVTGEKGFFDSRIVFVDETGPKEKRHKRLAVMDMDGANVKYFDGNGRHASRHAALLPVRPADRLHVVPATADPKRHAAQSRHRAAGGGGRFSRHDLRAAVFA